MTVDLLPHIKEPIRQEIAENYVRHELRKLLPNIKNPSVWEVIDGDVCDWYGKLSPDNFWNTIHGMSIGLRLNSIVPLITSKNVKWERKNINVSKLWFGGKSGLIKTLDCDESASDLKSQLTKSENNKLFEDELKKSDELFSGVELRDQFPIFVVLKDEKYRVIDGNQRLLRAILKDQSTILAVVGEEQGKPLLYEHWVPTSLLVDLVFWHKQQMKNDIDVTTETAKVIFEIIKNSSMGRYEFENRAIHKDDEIHNKLLNKVKELYK